MKRLLTTWAVAALFALACSVALAQSRYSPPGTNPGSSSPGAGNSSPPASSGPTDHHPDPTGLTLIASGAAAAVGYVMRRKRSAA